MKEISPILAQWDITTGCNFSCSFCLTNSGQCLNNEISYQNAKEVVDRLYDAGILFLRILGGEPFFRKDIMEIIRYAANKGMLISFSTNASLIDNDIARSLKELESNISYFQVSLYGTDINSYQNVTKNPKSFELAMKGIKNLIDNKMNPTIFWVLTADNIYNLEEAYNLTSNLGLSELRISPLLNLGRATTYESGSLETSENWKKTIDAFRRLKKLVEKNSSPNVILHARPMLGEYLHRLTGLKYFYITCKAAITMIYVDSKGDCSPCPFANYMPESYCFPYEKIDAMNILKNDFDKIWFSDSFMLYRKLHNPRDNPRKFSINCPHFKSGICDPCVFTPCTCKQSIQLISEALENI